MCEIYQKIVIPNLSIYIFIVSYNTLYDVNIYSISIQSNCILHQMLTCCSLLTCQSKKYLYLMNTEIIPNRCDIYQIIK